MSVTMRFLSYEISGRSYQGVYCLPDACHLSGTNPAILIAHTWEGCGEFVQGVARRLAGLGYIAFALDLYGEGRVGQNPKESEALMTPLLEDRAELLKRLNGSLQVLADQPEVDPGKIVAIGYCFGGLCVLDLARSDAPLCGVASFHGLLIPPNIPTARKIHCKILVLHGFDDPLVKPDTMLGLMNELTEKQADWQLHAYGNTLHAFTNPEANQPGFGAVYNPVADKRSWQSLLNFLDETIPLKSP